VRLYLLTCTLLSLKATLMRGWANMEMVEFILNIWIPSGKPLGFSQRDTSFSFGHRLLTYFHQFTLRYNYVSSSHVHVPFSFNKFCHQYSKTYSNCTSILINMKIMITLDVCTLVDCSLNVVLWILSSKSFTVVIHACSHRMCLTMELLCGNDVPWMKSIISYYFIHSKCNNSPFKKLWMANISPISLLNELEYILLIFSYTFLGLLFWCTKKGFKKHCYITLNTQY